VLWQIAHAWETAKRSAMTDRTQSFAADRRGEPNLIRVGLLIAAALMLTTVQFAAASHVGGHPLQGAVREADRAAVKATAH
jgi:hypothetical protein